MEGYLAFLDVLGFSEVARSRGRLREYLECLQAIDATGCRYVVFSDSIVLTVEGSEPERLLTLCRATSQLMYELLVKDFPLRGAIAFGEFERSEIGSGNVFVAGVPIVEAYKYEQSQNWVGVMLAPSARKQVPGLDWHSCNPNAQGDPEQLNEARRKYGDWLLCILMCSIPFKPDSFTMEPAQEGFAIFPAKGTQPEELAATLGEVMNHLRWLHSLAPSPAEQRKYAKTLRFVGDVFSRFQGCAEKVRQEREAKPAK